MLIFNSLFPCATPVQADSVSYWIEQGAPAEKLVLGLPMHGRGFALADPNNAEYGDLTTGPTQAQIYTREPGILSHYEVFTGSILLKFLHQCCGLHPFGSHPSVFRRTNLWQKKL